jgi:hypothetical protein
MLARVNSNTKIFSNKLYGSWQSLKPVDCLSNRQMTLMRTRNVQKVGYDRQVSRISAAFDYVDFLFRFLCVCQNLDYFDDVSEMSPLLSNAQKLKSFKTKRYLAEIFSKLTIFQLPNLTDLLLFFNTSISSIFTRKK